MQIATQVAQTPRLGTTTLTLELYELSAYCEEALFEAQGLKQLCPTRCPGKHICAVVCQMTLWKFRKVTTLILGKQIKQICKQVMQIVAPLYA